MNMDRCSSHPEDQQNVTQISAYSLRLSHTRAAPEKTADRTEDEDELEQDDSSVDEISTEELMQNIA